MDYLKSFTMGSIKIVFLILIAGSLSFLPLSRHQKDFPQEIAVYFQKK
jgi:hypothetical protein